MNRREAISLLPHAALAAVGVGDDKPLEVTVQRISLGSWRVWRFDKSGALIVDECQSIGQVLDLTRRVLLMDAA